MSLPFLRPLLQRALPLALAGLSLAPLPTRASDYTDLWYTPSESGWGVNIVQSDDGIGKPFLFLTFFIYGPDKKPTWYTGQLTWDPASGKYAGDLYLTTGTYFAQPWNTADKSVQSAGTVTFAPTNAYRGTLVYTVNGIASVTRTIERQTLTLNAIGGNYVGIENATYTSCGSNNGNGSLAYNLAVTQTRSGPTTFAVTYSTNLVCTLSGTLQQHGKTYEIPAASYTCNNAPNPISTTAAMSEITATAQGIEWRWTADLGAGCREDARFSAVLLPQ